MADSQCRLSLYDGEKRRTQKRKRKISGRRELEGTLSHTYLAIVCIVDREAADELPVLVAGYFELALELEEEEFG
jgi:hypothetical protein